MKQLTSFTKKEFLEQLRTGKLIIFCILFCLFGIMNPAIAKMTPWLFELMSEQFKEMGMIITEVEVNALTSWTQFFKNIPILLILFIVIFSSIVTEEYQKGTLINVITKGLKRWKILISKMIVMTVVWTIGYFITFGITYSYNAYFWDNRIVENLLFAVFGYYFIGLWLISVILLGSFIFKSASFVMIFVGTWFLISYLLGFFPILKEYMPTFLIKSNDLLMGIINIAECLAAVEITIFLIICNIILSIVFFNRKVI